MPRFAVPFAAGFAGWVMYGLAKAPTSKARMSRRSAMSSRFLIFCWRIDRFGTFKRNISELNGMISDFSRRTRWISTGIASARDPNNKNGFRNDINQMFYNQTLFERAARYENKPASSGLLVSIKQ